MIQILLLCAYIEHLTIFWTYSFFWAIENNKELIQTNGSLYVAQYALKIQFFILPLLGYIFYHFYSQIGYEQIISTPKFDSTELFQWLFMFFWEDIIFYHVHRILHYKPFYTFHKLHHSWITPVPWEALYSSIPENIFANFFPVLTAPIIVKLNIYYLFVWVAISTFTSLIAHSNFNTAHNLHHKHFNVNYGATQLFDYIYGTAM